MATNLKGLCWKLQERFASSQHQLQQSVPDLQANVIKCWVSGLGLVVISFFYIVNAVVWIVKRKDIFPIIALSF